MSKIKLYYCIFHKDNEILENTYEIFEFDTLIEAINKFYDLVKHRLSSYSGYDLFHDSPDYILSFVDKEWEEQWLKVKDQSNLHKHKFLKDIIKLYNPDIYEMELFRYDFFSYNHISHENIYILY